MREVEGGLVPLFTSQLCGNEGLGTGSHVHENWDFGHRNSHHLLDCWGAPNLRLALDTCSLLTPRRIRHHGSVGTIKYDEYNDLLSKEHKSLNKLPLTTTKNEITFLQTETHFPFSTTEILHGWCSFLF